MQISIIFNSYKDISIAGEGPKVAILVLPYLREDKGGEKCKKKIHIFAFSLKISRFYQTYLVKKDILYSKTVYGNLCSLK